MWFLLLLIFTNALVNNKTFLLEYRLDIAGVPVNVLDVLLALGVVVVLMRNQNSPTWFRTDRPHPLLIAIVVSYVLSTVGGLVASAGNGAEPRQIFTMMRNWITLPLSAWIAYGCIRNPAAGVNLARWHVLAGVGTATMILLFFFGKSASFDTGDNIDNLRTIAYPSAYAGLAVAFAFYCVISGHKILPKVPAIVLGGYCLFGQFATLSRSDWIPAVATIFSVYLLLPKEKRGGKLLTGLAVTPLLFASLWIGLQVASSTSGTNLFDRMARRLETLLPGDNPGGVRSKAWDTRIPGALKELELFASNPLIGRGFGIQDVAEAEMGVKDFGFRHNSWTSAMAESGVLGLTSIVLVFCGLLVVGRRMVREAPEYEPIVVGAFGTLCGIYFAIQGLATGSFNSQRGGILLGVVCGAVLRIRAMQLTARRMRVEAGGIAEPSRPGADTTWSGRPSFPSA